MKTQNSQGFLKSLFSTSAGTFLAILLNFVTITTIVKAIPEAEFGIYVLILVCVNALRIIAGLGLDLTLVKFVTGNEERSPSELLASILVVRLAMLLIISAIAWPLVHWAAPSLDARIADYTPEMLLIFVLMSVTELFYHLIQALKAFRNYAVLQVVSALVKLGCIVFFAQTGSLTLTKVIVMEVAALVALLLTQLILVREQFVSGFRVSADLLRAAFKFGLPLYLNSILTFVYGRASIFIMAVLLSPVSVAYYEVASKIPEGFQRLFRSFITVYFPNLSGLFASGRREQAVKFMNKSLVCLAFAGLFLALWAFLFRNELITLVFSESYRESALTFALLSISLCLTLLSYTMGYSLVSAGESSAPVKINTIASLVNLAANFALIPAFGFVGAAYSLIIMNGLGIVMNFFYLRRINVQVDPGALVKPALHFLVFLAAAAALGEASLLARIALLSVYAVTSVLFNAEMRRLSSASFLMMRGRLKRVRKVY